MNPLLGSVIAAHGGLDRWSTVRAIDVTFNFSGGLLDLKAIWWSASDLEHRRDSTRIPKKDRSLADLLGSVIAAHGGLDRWRTVRAIDVTFNRHVSMFLSE